jgi:hypothetical protein
MCVFTWWRPTYIEWQDAEKSDDSEKTILAVKDDRGAIADTRFVGPRRSQTSLFQLTRIRCSPPNPIAIASTLTSATWPARLLSFPHYLESSSLTGFVLDNMAFVRAVLPPVR